MYKKVLLIDDDPDLGRLVEVVLRPVDVTVYQSYSGVDGLRKAYETHPDLVILDVMMPVMDGFEVCTKLRELSSVPILMLTACNEPQKMLQGFDIGVDDYVRKPFTNDELEARVRALLRRSESAGMDEEGEINYYRDENFDVDLVNRIVKLNGEIVELTHREYNLLACFIREQGKVLSHHELVNKVWGGPFMAGSQSVLSLYVYYLRKKIQDGQHGHQYIHTFWGRGYWFEPRRSH